MEVINNKEGQDGPHYKVVPLPESEWVSAEIAANRLGVSLCTLKARAKAGDVPFRTNEGSLLYRVAPSEGGDMSPINATLFAVDDEEVGLQRSDDPLLGGAATSSPMNNMAEQIIQVLAERLVTAERQKTLAEVARDEALVIQEWGQERVAEIEEERVLAGRERDELRVAFEALRDEFQALLEERNHLSVSNSELKTRSRKENKAIELLWQDREIQIEELESVASERDELQIRNDELEASLTSRSAQFDAMAAAVDSLAQQLDETREQLEELQKAQAKLLAQRGHLQAIIGDVEGLAKNPLALPVRNKLLQALQTDIYIDPLAS